MTFLQIDGVAIGRDVGLSVLSVTVAALFVLTLAFSCYTVALRLRNEVRDRARTRFADRWREPLLRALGDPTEARAVQASIGEDERLRFVGFAVQFARRVRGEERQALRALVRPHLDPIAHRADSRNVEVRARAIQTLGELGLPEHAARVIAALDDASPLVAMVAARALARQESPAYAEPVLARLHRFDSWSTRFLASMLAAMGRDVSATFRAGLADAARPPKERAVLAEALQIQGDVLAADVAAGILGTAGDSDLLTAALRLVREVGRPEHAATVAPLCASPDVDVRAEALLTLGTLGGEAELKTLLPAMDDASAWAALNAARGVREAGGERLLIEIAGTERATAPLARQALAERRGG